MRDTLLRLLSPKEPIRLNLSLPEKSGVKATDGPGWIPLSSQFSGYLPRTSYDYESAVGDGLGSNVLMSCVGWIQRVITEAPFAIRKSGEEQERPLETHAIMDLLRKPNAFYSGEDLIRATVYSYVWGDAYWRKVRGKSREVSELWYVPHWLIEPKWPNGKTDVFISHYEYRDGGGGKVSLPLEDVIHFRNGINPRNTRKGMSQVYAVLREIFGDDEAANYASSLMKNMGVPGMMFTPDTDEPVDFDVEAMKAYLAQQFTGDNRGKPLVARMRSKIQQFGFDPKAMDVSNLRDIAEERVCAALGVRPAVVSYGSGLQQTKVGATMFEEVKLSWTNAIIPMQNTVARTLEMQLLPEFEPKPDAFKLYFDRDGVEALKENRKLTAETWEILVRGGIALRSEARQANGLEWGPADEVYLMPMSVIPEPAGLTPDEREAQKLAAAPPMPTEDDDELEPADSAKRFKTDAERRIAAHAQDAKPTIEQRAFMRAMVLDSARLESQAEDDFESVMKAAGVELEKIAKRVLPPKSALEDELMADRIMEEFDEGGLREKIVDTGRAHYLRVAKQSVMRMQETLGLAVDLPDNTARKIVAEGGRRLGLVDFSESLRKRLFRELTEGRSLGEGPAELARRIRDFVPAGPWATPKTRARVIARTETMHAQRFSALEAYKDAPNVSEVMVFDNRTGYDDPECAALDGKIVSFEEAYELMNEEHPNGTRAFAPVVGPKKSRKKNGSADMSAVESELQRMAALQNQLIDLVRDSQAPVSKHVERDKEGRIAAIVEEFADGRKRVVTVERDTEGRMRTLVGA